LEAPIVSLEGTYTLAGVAPAALALWLRGIMTQVICRPMALELVGEQPLDGSPMSVDAARAETWLRDPAAEPVKPWPGSKVKIDDVWHKDEIGRVKLAGKKASVDAFDDALKTALGFVVPRGATDLRDGVAIAHAGR